MELTVNRALEQGVVAHKEGRLEEAEKLYRAVLHIQPNHPDANHNLGLIAFTTDKIEPALLLFKTAVEANPRIEQFWISYISTLIKDKQFENAKHVIEQGRKQGVAGEKVNALATQLTFANQIEMVSLVGPSQQQLSNLTEYYQTGRYDNAKKLAIYITQNFPSHQFGWKVLGALLMQSGENSEAINPNQTAVRLSPEDSAAHNNLGVTLKALGRLDEAKIRYKKAIALKPGYAEAHNNLGNTLKELGRLDEAEVSCRQAIALKPGYAEAYNNLGVTLQKQGRLDEAEASYREAIELNPQIPRASQNLVELLTSYTPQGGAYNPIVKVDQEIKKISLKKNTLGIISDDEIIELYCESLSIIKRYNLELETELSQVYRRNSVDLNCKRHKAIFEEFSVIPEFCFGCYKVQVEPRSILELIKLFIVFDQINLVENNTRKCMIEMRPEISGFYKGLIYCSSLDEAYQIADYLEPILKENIAYELSTRVKRGCSEYELSFPKFSKINRNGEQLMNYNETWKPIEGDYDKVNPITFNKVITPNLSGLNLGDILIIRNWIDYAKGIEDPSVHALNQNKIFSTAMFNAAKRRLATYPR